MDTDLKPIFLYNLITEHMKGVSIMPKTYELKYKEYVSWMVVEEGWKPTELAREFNISDSALRRWLKEYKEKIGWVKKHVQKKTKNPWFIKRLRIIKRNLKQDGKEMNS